MKYLIYINYIGEVLEVHLHLFVDASNLACCTVTVAVVEHDEALRKGLLAFKARIWKRNTSMPILELVGGHMAANMAKNLQSALRCWPIKSNLDGQFGSVTVHHQSRNHGKCLRPTK